MQGRWLIRDDYADSLSELRSQYNAEWRAAFTAIKHKGVDMAALYDDIWIEEQKTSTMIISIITVVRCYPEYAAMAYDGNFVKKVFSFYGSRLPVLRGKVQDQRSSLAKAKREAEREKRTGISPILDRKIDALIQLRAAFYKEVKKEMDLRVAAITAAKKELEKLEKMWAEQAAEFDRIMGPLSISDKTMESWLEEFCSLPEDDKQRYGYDTTGFLEEKTKHHQNNARRVLSERPNFEIDLDQFMAANTKSLIESKVAMMRRWLASQDDCSFRHYFQGIAGSPGATGAMLVDTSESFDASGL